jgi:DNA-binding GntR family transcriptional regulator
LADLSDLKIEKPPTTLREIALDKMREAIIAGVFQPGQRLIERTLCEQIGVSRTVIREAIRHLDAEGLIEVIPNQGPIVSRLDWQAARQIYDIRSLLEADAAAACAENIDGPALQRLQVTLAALEASSAGGEPLDLLSATTAFYDTLFQIAGHDIAWEIVSRLNSRISRLRVMTLSTGDRLKAGPQRIRAIYEAIANRDPEAAAAACRKHLHEAREIARFILTTKVGG